MMPLPLRLLFTALLFAVGAWAQPTQSFVLGDSGANWVGGGGHRAPTILIKRRGRSVAEDTTNAPGSAIDFSHRPGWISPLFFDPEQSISARVLQGEGAVGLQGAFYGATSAAQLMGTVNGDHDVAFERKPDVFNTVPKTRDVWMTLDFSVPVGIHRVRFYPRNSLVESPNYPFQEDFLRAFELWINPTQTQLATPDRLVHRNTANDVPIVDIEVSPQYARLVKLRSLTAIPFEVDEIEVFGTGYMAQGVFLSDIIDLGERATVGPVSWTQEAVGDPLFSDLAIRVRTGLDDTPILYRERLRDSRSVVTGLRQVSSRAYYALDPRNRAQLEADPRNWSPWANVENGRLPAAPLPRRYIQLRVEFEGDLFNTRQVGELGFDYLVPPLADSLKAEIFPRLAEAEQPATFHYAVRLLADGPIRGFDRLEIDTNVEVSSVRDLTVNGIPQSFEVESIAGGGFALNFPLINEDDALLQFSFDLPIFRFGTSFSGRAFNRATPAVPQNLNAGNAADFGPGDFAQLSDLFVAIPEKQLGKLVGRIDVNSKIITPNGDGINDRLEISYNLLQLVEPAPVSLDIFSLNGSLLHRVFRKEHGIGPGQGTWDGRLQDGSLLAPGLYFWSLRVQADAFEEQHTGTVAVTY
jgi:hypothetical protein